MSSFHDDEVLIEGGEKFEIPKVLIRSIDNLVFLPGRDIEDIPCLDRMLFPFNDFHRLSFYEEKEGFPFFVKVVGHLPTRRDNGQKTAELFRPLFGCDQV